MHPIVINGVCLDEPRCREEWNVNNLTVKDTSVVAVGCDGEGASALPSHDRVVEAGPFVCRGRVSVECDERDVIVV